MYKQKIGWVIGFNLVIVVVELLFGWVSNSYALISDALHNFGDIISLVVTYMTLYKSYSANKNATLFNIFILYLSMFYIIYEAIGKLQNPLEVDATYMIIVGTIALVANALSAYMLSKMHISHCTSHQHQHDNIHSAYLHMFSDALISFGVIVGGVVIALYDVYMVDSVLTIVFSLYIMWHSYPMFIKAIR